MQVPQKVVSQEFSQHCNLQKAVLQEPSQLPVPHKVASLVLPPAENAPKLVTPAKHLPPVEVTRASMISQLAATVSHTPQPSSNAVLSTPMPTLGESGLPVVARTRRTPSPLDDHRVSQRQKQIDYGYRTVGYLRYRLLVSKDRRAPEHPRTPRKEQACSKRSWDGQLKKWRRELHKWDPEEPLAFQAMLESEFMKTMIASSPELTTILECIKDKIGKEVSPDDDEFECTTDADEAPSLSSSSEQVTKDGDQITVRQAYERVEVPTISDPLALESNFAAVARTLVF